MTSRPHSRNIPYPRRFIEYLRNRWKPLSAFTILSMLLAHCGLVCSASIPLTNYGVWILLHGGAGTVSVSKDVQMHVTFYDITDQRPYRAIPKVFWDYASVYGIVVPWYCPVLVWILCGPFVRIEKRGMCKRCGYDLNGASNNNCPECGDLPPRFSPQSE